MLLIGKSTQAGVLRQPVQIRAKKLWVVRLPYRSALCPNEMEERRQEHFNIEVVHVDTENVIELNALGRLGQDYAHDAAPISTRPSRKATRCNRDRPSNNSASFTGLRSSIALNSSKSIRNGSNSWLAAVYPSASRDRSSNMSSVTRSVGVPSMCVSSSVSGTPSLYGPLSWPDEQ